MKKQDVQQIIDLCPSQDKKAYHILTDPHFFHALQATNLCQHLGCHSCSL